MAAARCWWRTRASVAKTVSTYSRGVAFIIPKVSQIDNASDFLGKGSHRQHPGILHLKSVSLPPELVETARVLVNQSSVRNLEEQAKALTNYLWGRKRPTEAGVLRQKVQQVEQQLREKMVQAPQEDTDSPSSVAGLDEQKLRAKVLRAIHKSTYHWKELEYTDELSLIFMTARMDGIFAAVYRAFHEIHKRVPNFQPHSLLDFGSGTGAASWAAHRIWSQTIKEYMNIDSSASMLALAEKLINGLSEDPNPCFPGVYFRQFLPVSPKVTFDLVVSAYSLNDLPGRSKRIETVQTLWRKTNGFLVLVENGTKEGHQMLMEVRDIILQNEEKVVHDSRKPFIFAPCPHHYPCPRLSREPPLPCNFLQKYQPLPFSWNPQQKEERFFFLILSRGPGESTEQWPRITQPVLWRSRHAHVHLCCPDGSLQHAVLTEKKHGRDLFRCARNSQCGDRLPVFNPDGGLALETEEEEEEEESPMDKDQS